MTRFPKVLSSLTVVTALFAIPSGAAAAPFRDTVYRPAEAQVSATPAFRWTAPDGHVLRFKLSNSLGRTAETVARAQSYGLMLEDNLHSFEMSRLTVFIVRASEMADVCGSGALACYGGDEMVVTYGEIKGAGVSVAEVIAHEYGHHVAAYRRNSLGAAINWGPQAWASHESVCRGTDEGRLFPGDEWEHYWDNPGEGWAEAYAKLHYPSSRWEYSRLLRPTDSSFQEIAFDVRHRLSRPSQTTFSGDLGPGRSSQTFSLTVAQDTALDLALDGPSGSNYDLRLKTPGYYDETTGRTNSQDQLRTSVCFAQNRAKTVKVRVTRKSGSGPFTLRASDYDRYDALG